jgi:hypothetical protein
MLCVLVAHGRSVKSDSLEEVTVSNLSIGLVGIQTEFGQSRHDCQ